MTARIRTRARVLLLMVLAVRPAASAQATLVDANPRQGASGMLAADAASPRATLEAFRRHARAGRFAAAARFLEVDTATSEVESLARQLHAVLERSLRIDLDDLSSSALGDTADGLPRDIEALGSIVDSSGERALVRLVRLDAGGEAGWRFSRSTVRNVPGWYAALPDRWIHDHLPRVLLQVGPLNALWWQWAALPPLIGLACVIGWLLGHAVRATVRRLVNRTATRWDDVVFERLDGPITAVFALAAFAGGTRFLALYEPAEQWVLQAVRVGYFTLLFWCLWRVVDVGREVLSRSRWAHTSTSSRALLPLGGRIAKVGVLAIGIVAVLSTLGYPAASLIAGLGLGGLALALAAQKTVENLFGAFSIGIDQPFREGDFVKIEEFVGTVEAIGLRSTRFRTLDRTIITIPNGKLADMRLESFAARDRIRLAMSIGLVYETTSTQMREVLSGVERVLREHPKIWPDAVVVRFGALGPSSLDIEVMAWFETPDWGEFQGIRQDILLDIMQIVERAGTAFAFPTRTIHFASPPEFADGKPPAKAAIVAH